MFRKILLCSLVSLSCFADDVSAAKPEKDSFFYLKYGSGASISTKCHVEVDTSYWDSALEGYAANIGTRPILDVGLGYEFIPLVAAEITGSYRPNFKYVKPQTANTSNPFSQGDKTRRFTLDVTSLMGSLYLNGLGINALKWDFDSMNSCMYPFIGAGIGISRLTMFDFLSTGVLSGIPGDSYTLYTSANAYNVHYRFTYQVMAGFEYRYQNRWALSLGYRWFHVNRFNGPRYIRDSTGIAYDASGFEWSIPFSANEVTLELKVLF